MKLKDVIKENIALVSPIVTNKPIGTVGTGVKMTDLVKEEEKNEAILCNRSISCISGSLRADETRGSSEEEC